MAAANFHASLPATLLAALRREARKQDRPVSRLVKDAVRGYLMDRGLLGREQPEVGDSVVGR